MAGLETLPDNLPVPVDDGACDHLVGSVVPSVTLEATAGGEVDLSQLSGVTVVFCYPRTGAPGATFVTAAWDAIPGARGCTPQACSFRDHYGKLLELNVKVFGLSTQSASEQLETSSRLHLPFPLLSDSKYALAKALQLPTFEFDEFRMIKRHTLIIQDGKIVKVFYPVFPPNEDVKNVIGFLREFNKSKMNTSVNWTKHCSVNPITRRIGPCGQFDYSIQPTLMNFMINRVISLVISTDAPAIKS